MEFKFKTLEVPEGLNPSEKSAKLFYNYVLVCAAQQCVDEIIADNVSKGVI